MRLYTNCSCSHELPTQRHRGRGGGNRASEKSHLSEYMLNLLYRVHVTWDRTWLLENSRHEKCQEQQDCPLSQLSLEQADQTKKQSYCLDKAIWGYKKEGKQTEPSDPGLSGFWGLAEITREEGPVMGSALFHARRKLVKAPRQFRNPARRITFWVPVWKEA